MDQLLIWAAEKTTVLTLAAILVGVGVAVQIAKRSWKALCPWSAFADWWLAGAVLGAVAGAVLIELSLAGAVAGLVVGALATGGYEYLKGLGGLLGNLKGPGPTPLLVAAIGAGLLFSASGCGVDQAVLRTTQFEQAELAEDATWVGVLFADRQAANERLLKALDTALETTLKTNPGRDAAWVLDTVRVHEALRDVLKRRESSDLDAKRVVLDNFEKRQDALKRAADLVVRSQAWSTETQKLVTDLLGLALEKVVPRPAPAPLVSPAPATPPVTLSPIPEPPPEPAAGP